MAVFNEGESIGNLSAKTQVNPRDLKPGVYVFYYKAPISVFSLIKPETLTGALKAWLNLRAKLGDAIYGNGELAEIRGVQVNTDTGDIYIKARLAEVKRATIKIDGKDVPVEVQEAGVNPWAVYAAIAALLGAIGIGITLLAVYSFDSNEECKAGALNQINCVAKKAKWLVVGLVVGAVFMALYLFKEATR